MLKGDVEDVLLLDVTPLSLGVETQGGVFTKIIEKNTTIPAIKSQVFSTTEINQDVVRIHVLQGEREMAADNMTLGRFELVGIPPAPRGVPQIEVAFALDTDGVVSVSAKDLGTGKSQSIVVTGSSGSQRGRGRSPRPGGREPRRAGHAAIRELTLMRNKADGLIYSTEKTLEEFAEDVDGEDRTAIEEALESGPREREGRGHRGDPRCRRRALDADLPDDREALRRPWRRRRIARKRSIPLIFWRQPPTLSSGRGEPRPEPRRGGGRGFVQPAAWHPPGRVDTGAIAGRARPGARARVRPGPALATGARSRPRGAGEMDSVRGRAA